jgi:hypothetical protein
MGSRTNFIVKQGENRFVTLYSHWGGGSKVTDLARALDKARPRWHDYGYATRILFNELQDNHDSETGYGIYADEFGGEENYESTIIDFTNQTVILEGEELSFSTFIDTCSPTPKFFDSRDLENAN